MLANLQSNRGPDNGLMAVLPDPAFDFAIAQVFDKFRRAAHHGRAAETVAKGQRCDALHAFFCRQGGKNVWTKQRHLGRLQKNRGHHYGDVTARGRNHQPEFIGRFGAAVAQAAFLCQQTNAHANRNGNQQHKHQIGPRKPPQQSPHQRPRGKAAQQDQAGDDDWQKQSGNNQQLLQQNR